MAYILNGQCTHHNWHILLHHGEGKKKKKWSFQDYMIHKARRQRKNPVLYPTASPNPEGWMSDCKETWPWLLGGILGAKGWNWWYCPSPSNTPSSYTGLAGQPPDKWNSPTASKSLHQSNMTTWSSGRPLVHSQLGNWLLQYKSEEVHMKLVWLNQSLLGLDSPLYELTEALGHATKEQRFIKMVWEDTPLCLSYL